MGIPPSERRLTLAGFSPALRLLLAVFLISVGLGYFSALVQLHHQLAGPGRLLPSPEDAVEAYHGQSRVSQLQRLLTANESKPFNGSGQMRTAFTTDSAGWRQLTKRVSGGSKGEMTQMERLLEADSTKSFNGDGTMRPAFTTRSAGWERNVSKRAKQLAGEKNLSKEDARAQAEKDLLAEVGPEREGERLALLDWMRKGMNKEAYDKDEYLLAGALVKQPITSDFLKDENGKRFALIKSIIDARCVRCHKTSAGGVPARYPLEEYEQFAEYCDLPGTTPRARPEPAGDPLAKVLEEREGERLAVLRWIRTDDEDRKKFHEQDRFPLPQDLAQQAITAAFVGEEGEGKRYVKVQSILEARCVRCHAPEVGGAPAQYPLDSYERVRAYCDPESGTGMSLAKLAQTTHVHLLGFSMLYGLTGLIFAFSTYPSWLRCLVCPLPLIAQVIDIACWWLGRTHPAFAQAVVFTGGIVALGLFAQIALALPNLLGSRKLAANE